jgi:hypothetical protein
MVLVDTIVAVVMLGMSVLLSLDSRPAKSVLYLLARWRHRRYDRRPHIVGRIASQES